MSDTPKPATKPKPEKYLSVKEIAYEFSDRGIPLGIDYVRIIVHELTRRGLAIRGRYCRMSDAWNLWCFTPDWMPYSRHEEKRRPKTLGYVESSKP